MRIGKGGEIRKRWMKEPLTHRPIPREFSFFWKKGELFSIDLYIVQFCFWPKPKDDDLGSNVWVLEF